MDRSPTQTALLPASQALDSSRSVPVVLERAGANALFAADEFFGARISNPHTRRACGRFLSLAGHANPRATQIYDRRPRVTRNIVERISV